MTVELIEIQDLDQRITHQLAKIDLNTEEILHLVDTRERLLLKLLPIIQQNPLVKQEPEWQALLTRTQHMVELMQSETSKAGKKLQQFRYGQRSLQQYKKFI